MWFSFPHKGKPCPARQAMCSNCGVKGHFAKVCRKPKSAPERNNTHGPQVKIKRQETLAIKSSLGKVIKLVKFLIHLQMNPVQQMINMPMPWTRKEHIPQTKLSHS